MSENKDSGSKTEQPTNKKLKDSRKQGQVAQSKDITIWTALIVILVYFGCTWHHAASILMSNYTIATTQVGLDPSNYTLNKKLTLIVRNTFSYFLLPIILAAAISFLVEIIQMKGLVVNEKGINFDFERINPVSNFKQIFSKKSFLRFLKQLAEVIIISVISYFFLYYNIKDLVLASNYSLTISLWLYALLLFKLFLVLLGVYIVMAVIDYVIEYKNLMKELMMSKDEIKREMRDTDGKPEVKQRQQELRDEMREDGLANSLSQASFILANPTHIAIVIYYDPRKQFLPFIVLKVKGYHAKIIFRVAKKINMPIFCDIWLARQIFEYSDVGWPIIERLAAPLANLIGKNLDKLPKIAEALTNPFAKPAVGALPKV